MHTALYVIWFLIPTCFFLLALWAKLEQISNRSRAQNPGDLLRQGYFVLASVLVSVLIDHFILEKVVISISPTWLPIGFYRIILLPMVLLLGAKIAGPSKDIRIAKAPRPTQQKRR